MRPRPYCKKWHTSSLVCTKKPRFRVVSKSAPNKITTIQAFIPSVVCFEFLLLSFLFVNIPFSPVQFLGGGG
nr:MAG TPA: hypothetical protein [Caudoviricetes sp.]